MIFAKLSILYFVYFALLGVMAPYLGLYLESQEFSLFEIAQLASLLMMTKIVAPLLWGSIADRYQNSVFLVRLGSFMTMLCYLGFFVASTFWQYVVVIMLFSFFWNAILPQIEVITLFNLAGYQDRYSRIRLWGSVGFIVSVVGAGWFFELAGISYFPLVLLLIIFAIWGVSYFKYEESKIVKVASSESVSLVSQLMQTKVVLFFIICFLLQVSHGAYYTYFSIYLESLSYSKSVIGWLWSLGVLAEIILFLFMHRWFELHNIKIIMVIALLLTVARWYFVSEYSELIIVIIIMQCLHAFSFGAMHSVAIKFVHYVFSECHQGRAQAMYSSFGFGAGGAVGAYVCGLIVSQGDYELVFKFSAGTALLALIFALFMSSNISNKSKVY